MLIPSGQTDKSYRPLNEFCLWKLKTDTFSFPAARLLRSMWEHHDIQADGEMEQEKVFWCTCVKAKQTLESQLFLWVISDDLCYNLRFTAKQRGRGKKITKRNKKPQTSPRERPCKSLKTTEKKQREGMEASWK